MLSEFHLISGLGGTVTSNVITINILHWEIPLTSLTLLMYTYISSFRIQYRLIPLIPSNPHYMIHIS